jgi:hypothetical protein
MGASASSFSADIGGVLSDVSIFTTAGQPVMFKDLWDQNEVLIVSLNLMLQLCVTVYF